MKLKKITDLLNRSEGLSLISIIVIMVIMAIMGTVFSSIMGTFKVSAPMTINSKKAFYLAETAATFALQEAKYKFYGGSFNYGSSTDDPYVVSSVTTGNVTEVADYWFEMPDLSDDVTTGVNDDEVDDDDDDSSDPTLYSIIATGRVNIGGSMVAKRQIKVNAIITDNSVDPVEPGIHTEGSIRGSGVGAFNIWKDGLDMSTDPSSIAFSNGTFATSSVPPSSCPDNSCREDVVYQAPDEDPPDLDEEFFKVMAVDQGHYNPTVVDNYPNSSYYYDTPTNTIPNITYISGDLSPCNNKTIYGIYWVKGDVSLGGNWQVNGIIICEGDVKMNGGGSVVDPNMNGGIIQYGSSNQLWAAGNPSIIQINNDFFDALNNTIPIITVQSWQETVSAN